MLTFLAQLAEVVEYTDYISAETYDSSNMCPGCDTKLLNVKAQIQEPWGMWSIPSLPLLPTPL